MSACRAWHSLGPTRGSRSRISKDNQTTPAPTRRCLSPLRPDDLLGCSCSLRCRVGNSESGGTDFGPGKEFKGANFRVPQSSIGWSFSEFVGCSAHVQPFGPWPSLVFTYLCYAVDAVAPGEVGQGDLPSLDAELLGVARNKSCVKRVVDNLMRSGEHTSGDHGSTEHGPRRKMDAKRTSQQPVVGCLLAELKVWTDGSRSRNGSILGPKNGASGLGRNKGAPRPVNDPFVTQHDTTHLKLHVCRKNWKAHTCTLASAGFCFIHM